MRIISPKRLLESVAPTVRNGSIFNASSLDLQFARTKTLDPRVTFTRASSGTYVGSDGLIKTATTNEARFDHNPTTGESLGLLVEEQRTNLLLRSEEFDNASWSKPQSDTITANSVTSLAGAATADSFVENTASGAAHTLFQDGTITANSINTFSCFFKAAGRTQILIKLSSVDDASGCAATFDLSAEATSAIANYGTASGAVANMQAFANGWYRCVISGSIGSSLTTTRIRIRSLSAGNETYTGNGQTAYYIWGAQLEAGAFPTSYIPTTTAAVTRSADVASITGTAFSSWYRQDEGTVFADGTVSQGLSSFPWLYNVTDGTTNNSIGVYEYTNGIYGSIVTSGTPASPDAVLVFSPSSGALLKHALAIKNSDTRAAVNGSLSTAQLSTLMPSVNQMAIGQRVTANRRTGTIRRLTYWPSRLPNSTLQEITR